MNVCAVEGPCSPFLFFSSYALWGHKGNLWGISPHPFLNPLMPVSSFLASRINEKFPLNLLSNPWYFCYSSQMDQDSWTPKAAQRPPEFSTECFSISLKASLHLFLLWLSSTETRLNVGSLSCPERISCAPFNDLLLNNLIYLCL